MKKKILLLLPLLFSLASCNPGVGPTGPAGQDGVDGVDGQDGHSPELTIGTNGNWYIDGEDTGIKATGADGEDGKDGLDGQDGDTPRIGANGNWWIGNVDTGIKAEGQDGEDGKTPEITIGDEGNWYIDGEDTGKSAIGADGLAPHIGENGNWWIGDEDTNIPARGQDGEDGKTPNITIGENGNWYIDGEDTGKPATVTQTHIVTLDPNGGQLPEGTPTSYQILEGWTIDDLPVPTRSDYDFLGWYTGAEEYAGRFTETTMVFQDYDLVAKWQPLTEATFTVTWLNYDGTVLEKDEGVVYKDMPEYDGQEPTREAGESVQYAFSGWTPELSPVIEDITYIATYAESPRKLTVSFDIGDYGAIAAELENVPVDWGSEIAEPEVDMENVPENIGFLGWFEDEELTRPVAFPYVPTSDITLHAGWKETSTDLTYYYDQERDGYVVRSYNASSLTPNIAIPSTYDDGVNGVKNVVGLAQAFKNNNDIVSIALPDTLQYIGEEAFANSSVRFVSFPSSLESIGKKAFVDSSLHSADLSSTKLTEIAESTFENAPLTSVSLPSSVISIGNRAFYQCSSLSSVDLPSSLKDIGNFAFYATGLTSLVCNDGLQSVGSSAFRDCSSLSEVTFNDGLQSIGSYAFSYNAELTSLILPSALTTVGANAFLDCPSLVLYCLSTSRPEGWDENFAGYTAYYWYSEEDPGSTPGNYWHYDENQKPVKW